MVGEFGEFVFDHFLLSNKMTSDLKIMSLNVSELNNPIKRCKIGKILNVEQVNLLCLPEMCL